MKHGKDYEEICNDLADEFAVRVRFDFCTTRVLKYDDRKCLNCPFFNENKPYTCLLKLTELRIRNIATKFEENDVLNGGEI